MEFCVNIMIVYIIYPYNRFVKQSPLHSTKRQTKRSRERPVGRIQICFHIFSTSAILHFMHIFIMVFPSFWACGQKLYFPSSEKIDFSAPHSGFWHLILPYIFRTFPYIVIKDCYCYSNKIYLRCQITLQLPVTSY